MSINFPVTIKIMYEEEAKGTPYVAYIPEFDISSCGKTETSARKNVREALGILLEEVKKKGHLDAFLKEAGITIEKKSAFPKIVFESFSTNI